MSMADELALFFRESIYAMKQQSCRNLWGQTSTVDLVVGIVVVVAAAAVFAQLEYHCPMFYCHKLQMNGNSSEEEEMAQISYWAKQSL